MRMSMAERPHSGNARAIMQPLLCMLTRSIEHAWVANHHTQNYNYGLTCFARSLHHCPHVSLRCL